MKTYLKLKFIFLICLTPSISNATKTVQIAVIDSGIDLSHPQIRKSLFINKGETGIDKNGNDKSTNNIDDDNNGFVDDVSGWDFVDFDNQVTDSNGHGTHIAGIILGLKDSKSKAEKNIQILPLKYYRQGESGALNLIRSIAALKYAIDMEVDIINYSGGGISPDPHERRLIQQAQQKGIIIVSAAGNYGKNLKEQKFYPASYGFKNIIAVSALSGKGRIMNESNYGSEVDLIAIGENVFSTLPHGRFGQMSGTSQATANVTRSLAKLLKTKPSLKSKKQGLVAQIGRYDITDLSTKTRVPSARSLSPTLVPSDNMVQLFPQQ